ncbi:hypothetical protein TraAM80_10128 [Trypanosoma rangeli]|uniref:Uncharacterized protein n=1 Tax=Trypanosoma rangeli TaxID=5698 RepID=A0A422MR75_TRYRA|nr:uncharacterized protein TraAM80_10128 [Trypanosoma rangeli]RNE95691.1 hypothetical protein TraAM80_10128 [Trypanosoma rangeli]|eukprot:RNE95691.1 hypothetical protein TraAM80_10128 [Trypanosoma rangeli]
MPGVFHIWCFSVYPFLGYLIVLRQFLALKCLSSLLCFRLRVMFIGRWVYNKGQTVDSLSRSRLWQKRGSKEADSVATTLYGCILFLKDDVVNCLGAGGGELSSLSVEGDLLNSVMQWACGGWSQCGEGSEGLARKVSLFFPCTSSGPRSVVERCVGDPCSFGVIAGFVCRYSHSEDDAHAVDGGGSGSGSVNLHRESSGNGLSWEWGELINCTTISQLRLYLDSPLPVKGMREA